MCNHPTYLEIDNQTRVAQSIENTIQSGTWRDQDREDYRHNFVLILLLASTSMIHREVKYAGNVEYGLPP